MTETGNVEFAELIDRAQAGEKSVDLPCTGVFTIRDGKIASWRDYFDRATFSRAMQGRDPRNALTSLRGERRRLRGCRARSPGPSPPYWRSSLPCRSGRRNVAARPSTNC